ncbi:recombinase family protein [Actinomadura gamaensis]|uniref:Recombinase family protein n=1 Tax=Actinomadura gamaensis TaxID=1763541 RepID=A0ABV9U8Y4_9ACTN
MDLGPHPNPTKAADGKRLHGLEIDLNTAPIVVRIFIEFLAGRGLFAIAEGLTHDGVPCPSAYDPARNRHRCGVAWSKGAVRAILTNPRYTGRQVWNRQRKDEVLLDLNDVTLGHVTKMRWNEIGEWVVSDKIVQTPIIDDTTFRRAQELLKARGKSACVHKPHRSKHTYVFKGRVYCGLCHRKMQSQWINKAPYYRCKFAEEYAIANKIDHPRNVYLREDAILGHIDDWLTTAFAPDNLAATIEALASAQGEEAHDARAHMARSKLAEAATKMARHRAALEAGGDPTLINQWIAETKADRQQAEAELRAIESRSAMSREQITAMLDDIGDVRAAIAEGDPEHKAAVYQRIGLTMVYHPGERKVRAEAHLSPHSGGVPKPDHIVKGFVSEGGHKPLLHARAIMIGDPYRIPVR